MANELDLTVSQLCLRVEQAERLLQWLVDNGTETEQMRQALESLRTAKINITSFVNESD